CSPDSSKKEFLCSGHETLAAPSQSPRSPRARTICRLCGQRFCTAYHSLRLKLNTAICSSPSLTQAPASRGKSALLATYTHSHISSTPLDAKASQIPAQLRRAANALFLRHTASVLRNELRLFLAADLHELDARVPVVGIDERFEALEFLGVGERRRPFVLIAV